MTTQQSLIRNAYKVAWLRSLPRNPFVFPVAAGFSLPYSFIAADYDDGLLPSLWSGATFRIASNIAYNSPALGAELLTDPGLEANYTAGLCDTLTKQGIPNLAQSSDVHGGTKAQQYQSVAGWHKLTLQYNGLANTWYRLSGWCKRLAGTQGRTTLSGLVLTGISPQGRFINDATYTQLSLNTRTPPSSNLVWIDPASGGGAPFDTLVVDDISIKAIQPSTMYSVLDTYETDVTIQAVISDLEGFDYSYIVPTGAMTGITLRFADSSNAIVCYIDGQNVYLDRCIAGIYTNYVDELALFDETKVLKLVSDGTTIKAYYDGFQMGADQTISHASLNSNTKAGLFSAGGGDIDNFYAFKTSTRVNLVAGYAGSSITVGTFPRYWASQTRTYLQETYLDQNWTACQICASGANSWYNLHELRDGLFCCDPVLIVFDIANDSTAFHKASEEAFIRVIRNFNPAIKIVCLKNNNKTWIDGLASLYVFSLCRWYEWALAEIAAGRETWLTLLGDGIHPSTHGNDTIAALMNPLIDTQVTDPANQYTGALPARIYDNGDLEYLPITLYGIEYVSRAGVWVDTGSSTASITPGSTITYSGTFRSFGRYNASLSYPDVSVVIDGGAPINPFAWNSNGYDIGTRAAHTVVITVLTTCTIDEFWAI